MNTSKHTPGPWHYENIVGHHSVNMPDGNSFTVENEHDAHLIAAAPAMYEALKIAQWLENECDCHEAWNAPEGNLCGHCTAELAIKNALAQADGRA